MGGSTNTYCQGQAMAGLNVTSEQSTNYANRLQIPPRPPKAIATNNPRHRNYRPFSSIYSTIQKSAANTTTDRVSRAERYNHEIDARSRS
jgi:hypothetical protein